MSPGSTVHEFLLVAAVLTSGLLAGFFYAYSCSVLPGLRRTEDATFVETMTAINEAVRNPLFALSFLGGPLLTATSAVLAVLAGTAGPLLWGPSIATLLHVLAFLVTGGGNLRLNAALARDASSPAQARARFTDPWRRLNALRGALVAGSVVALSWAVGAG